MPCLFISPARVAVRASSPPHNRHSVNPLARRPGRTWPCRKLFLRKWLCADVPWIISCTSTHITHPMYPTLP